MNTLSFRSYLLSFFLSLFFVSCSTNEIAQNKKRIIFFGDSITQQGVEPGGYVTIVKDTLAKIDAKYEIIGAGISGNKITDLQARVDNDVLAKKPNLVVIYIGINDVWHYAFTSRGLTGTPKDIFEKELRLLIQKFHSAGIQVVLCTPSVIGEKNDGSNEFDNQLDEYSAISRNAARQTGAALCDLRAAFVSHIKNNNPSNLSKNILTTDGVHLNSAGNKLVALQILNVFDGLGFFFPAR